MTNLVLRFGIGSNFQAMKEAKFAPRQRKEDLMQLPEVKGWEIAFGGIVQVSPAKPACTDTEVRVETSLTDLAQRVKDELSEKYDQQFADQARKMKLLETYLSKGEAAYVLHVAKYTSLRVIEE
jgi:hypothetical protein